MKQTKEFKRIQRKANQATAARTIADAMPVMSRLVKDSQTLVDVAERRNVAETSQVVTGNGPAKSSHPAMLFNLISPYVIRRLAQRFTVGGRKYGLVQWRQGINDAAYVADRFNHLIEHLTAFQAEGNSKDDNLAAAMWNLAALMEVERLCPEALTHVVGITDLFGPDAVTFHQKEQAQRKGE